jgi:hypothetical protein
VTSLLDIGPLTDKVPVRGKDVTIKGISGKDILILLNDFPEMRKLMGGQSLAITPDLLIARVPGALSSIIVLACGEDIDNDAAHKSADALTVGEQVEFIHKIWKLTFPSGTQSFLDAVQEIKRLVGGASGWDRDTQSPAPSSSSSDTDTQEKTSGTTPPA